MIEPITIARPYAKAAFDSARHSNTLSDWDECLSACAAYSQDIGFKKFLNAPEQSDQKKISAFEALLDKPLSEPVKRFLSALAVKGRVSLLPEIYAEFRVFKAKFEKCSDVYVVTAYPLSADQEKNIVALLEKKLGSEVNLFVTEDSGLLGGVVIRVGDLVMDHSIKGRLSRLSDTLAP